MGVFVLKWISEMMEEVRWKTATQSSTLASWPMVSEEVVGLRFEIKTHNNVLPFNQTASNRKNFNEHT